MTANDVDEVRKAFAGAVNMPPARLEKWLRRRESREVGWAGREPKHAAAGKEAIGHASGRRIVVLKRKKKAELTEDDLAHMRKVIGYVHRHLAQRPDGDVSRTRWRYPLMNWGHDPLKRA